MSEGREWFSQFWVNVDDKMHEKLEAGARERLVGCDHHEGEVFFIVRGGRRRNGKWNHPCIPEALLDDYLESYPVGLPVEVWVIVDDETHSKLENGEKMGADSSNGDRLFIVRGGFERGDGEWVHPMILEEYIEDFDAGSAIDETGRFGKLFRIGKSTGGRDDRAA